MTDDGDAPTDPPSTAAADGKEPERATATGDELVKTARPAPAAAGTRDELPPAHVHNPVDEPKVAAAIRRFDDGLGAVERALLFAALLVLIGTGLYRTVLSWGFKESSLAAIEVSRISAFAIGIFGAAYATQSRRNFGLDLVSALMSTRFKAYTRVLTNTAALVAGGLLFYGGRRIQEALTIEKQHYELIPISVVGWFIPICAVLIMVHVFCHLIIEIDYLRQGKTAPEPEVVG